MCPESPKFNLVIRQRRNEAESDLKKLRGEDDVSMEMKRMDKEADFARSQPKVRLADMFGPQLRWPLALAVFMMVSQQLSGINAGWFCPLKIQHLMLYQFSYVLLRGYLQKRRH